MKSEPPVETFTFLFTDIAGSTRLAQTHPAAMTTMLARHHAILRAAIESNHGHVFQIVGDSFCAAFHNALDALHAALDGQRRLQAEAWGEIGPLLVRMGLHTGMAKTTEDTLGMPYAGYATLASVQRIMSAAHGGQILLSQVTRDLLGDLLPSGVALLDVGEHHLKDLLRPIHIYQVAAADLPVDFPRLRAPPAAPHNLPVQLTSLIGREQEINALQALLQTQRLITLTGPGGSGKTRLALQVATEAVEQFPDGVFFIALAPIAEPGLVATTIAQTVGATESAGRSVFDSLKEYLRDRHLLLFLDNFEQVISAAPRLAELVAACSKLDLLVTSREALRVRGEYEYPVTSLALPNLAKLPPAEDLSQYAAVKLFIQRAQAVKPDFHLTNETAPAVAEICYRLDGLPLAIELAAARIKLLPPATMLARLEHRLEFLTGGARDLPARHQTLHNAIAWSYDLLNESEQTVFRRLSVFVGGCTLDAAEAVVTDTRDRERGLEQARGFVLEQLSSLLDKSLLQEGESTNDEPRFVMLELLREFGLEQLELSAESEAVRRRHATFFLALAEQAEARLESADQVHWMNRLEQEHDNLRAALEWSKQADNTGELCLRLAGTLGLFWEAHGYLSEGRERLSAVLATETAQARTPARAKVLARAAELAYRQSDYPATISFAAASLAICRELGDRPGSAVALIKLGNAAMESGDYAAAPWFLEEALTIWRDLEDKHGTARALISLGWVTLRSGEYELANVRLGEALALSRELRDTRSMGFELSGLGEVALRQGDYARAARLVEESLELRRQMGHKWGVGVSLGTLGWIALRAGDLSRAVTQLSESLEVRQEIGDKSGSAWCLERLAEVVLAEGQAERGARVLGAAAALRASIGSVIDPVDQSEYESTLASLRTRLSDERFTAIWDEGQAMTLEQAVELALQATN
jgi:predicted ATPase/class 3 adenylate cyclase